MYLTHGTNYYIYVYMQQVQTTRAVKRFTRTIAMNVAENIVRELIKKLLSADLCNDIGLG